MRRRTSLLGIVLAVFWSAPCAHLLAAEDFQPPQYPPVVPGTVLRFPADHGAHPAFRTEWWYVTGWLESHDGRNFGFQVTFFRTRPETDQKNPSAFAPKQILFAHAALSDPVEDRLLHDQRAARAGFGLAEAATGDTDIVIDDWYLRRAADGRFHAKATGAAFALDLVVTPTQPVLLQGENGYSRKGPVPEQASYYYSIPHLQVSGTIMREAEAITVTGSAWMDHEWSSTLLDDEAVGWDWTGLNLADGGALTAFRIRSRAGEALWAGGSLRSPDGTVVQLGPDDVRFTALRRWRSPRTGAEYPVEIVLTVNLPAGTREFRLEPLFDDQELDSRQAGGPVYWEGAVRTRAGRGYLELTGYAQPLQL